MRQLFVLINIVVINVSFLISFHFRYGFEIPEYNFAPYKTSYIFLTLIFVLSLAYAGVFSRRFRSYWVLFSSVLKGVVYGTLICVVFIYLLRVKWSTFPSSVFLINIVTATVLLFSVNAVLLRFKNRILKKVVILGSDQFFDAFGKTEKLVKKRRISRIDELINLKDFDEIMISKNIVEEDNFNLLIFLLTRLNVTVTFSPSLYSELLSGRVMKENTVQFLKTFAGRQSELEETLIRAADLIISSLLLIVSLPVMVIAALLIKLTTGQSVIYKQERVGKDAELFTLYKFKTMVDDAEKKTGPVLAAENDARVTKIGRFLRQTRLDELPQLINVIKGDMSLVGPRPERMHFVKLHKTLRQIRLAVKPGLTGLAQVRSYYDLHPKHKIKYDYLYIQRRSLMLNIYLMLKTIPVVICRKGR